MSANKKILILPGDGIGPEVMNEVRSLIDWMDHRRSVTFDIKEGMIGGVAIDKTGGPLPDETLNSAKNVDAILVVGGSVGLNFLYISAIEFSLDATLALLSISFIVFISPPT